MNKKKILSLEGIRALCFLGVVFGHTGLLSSPIVVSTFIILSGFLMTYSYYEKEVKCSFLDNLKFSLKKLKPLIPLNIFLITLCFVIYFFIFGMNMVFIKQFWWVYIVDVLMLQAWLIDQKIVLLLNGLSWYLSTMLFLYFVFPYALKVVKKYKNNVVPIVLSIIIYLIQNILGIIFIKMNFANELIWCLTYVNPLFRLGDFFIGMNIGFVFLNIKKDNIDIKNFSIYEIITCFLVFIVVYLYKNPISFLKYDVYKTILMYTPISTILIFVFAFDKGIVSKLLANKIFKFLAMISPFGFLIHYQLVDYTKIILSVIGVKEGFGFNLILFVIVMTLTIIFSKIYMKIIKVKG